MMFGLFGPKKTGGNSSLLADGSFAFFGCAALLFLLLAAPMLALVIVARTEIAAIFGNVAAAFGGDRLWQLVIYVLLLIALLYLARYIRDVSVARAESKRPQVNYPPVAPVEQNLYRGFSAAEIQQMLTMQQQRGPTAPTGPTPPTLGNVPYNVGGRALPGQSTGNAPSAGSGSGPSIGWRR